MISIIFLKRWYSENTNIPVKGGEAMEREQTWIRAIQRRNSREAKVIYPGNREMHS